VSLIDVIDLSLRYGERDVLKNINLRVDKGEVLALIGPTGAGKTSVLRLLDLLDMPTSGKIYFDGIDTAESARVRLEARRRMALVLQKPIVFNASVYDNIAFGLKWRGVARNSLRGRVNQILEMTDLYAERDRNARTLSGGEVQRVAIARAVAIEPEVLLMDEPTANLDPNSSSRIEKLITEIIHRFHTTIIMATHDMSQGQRLANRIAVLIDGEILQTGGSTEIFTYPRNREVAEFVGVENIIDGIIIGNEEGLVTIETGGEPIEAVSNYPVGEKISVCVRPENVTLALSLASSSARNSFLGEIIRVEPDGPLTRIEIDCGFKLTALITKRSAESLGLTEGKQVYATFKAAAIHVIKRN